MEIWVGSAWVPGALRLWTCRRDGWHAQVEWLDEDDVRHVGTVPAGRLRASGAGDRVVPPEVATIPGS